MVDVCVVWGLDTIMSMLYSAGGFLDRVRPAWGNHFSFYTVLNNSLYLFSGSRSRSKRVENPSGEAIEDSF